MISVASEALAPRDVSVEVSIYIARLAAATRRGISSLSPPQDTTYMQGEEGETIERTVRR